MDQTFDLLDRFEQFIKCTKKEGERRMKAMLFRIDQVILDGHKNRSEIAFAMDGLNEDWADLLEMMSTRKELLKSALALHRFFYDTEVRPLALLIESVNNVFFKIFSYKSKKYYNYCKLFDSLKLHIYYKEHTFNTGEFSLYPRFQATH